MTLLEVLVATAIFLLAIGGISRLVTMAGDRALEVQWRSQEARLCQSKMAEVQAGVVPLSGQDDTPFDEDPNFHWSVTANSTSVANVWTVTVKVTRDVANGTPIETSLSQMVLDPSVIGSTQNTTPIAGTTQAPTVGATGTTGTSGGM
jgi:Tfp pilus assembly protein PilV